MFTLRNLVYKPTFRPTRFLTILKPDPTKYPEDEYTTTDNYDYHVNQAGRSKDFKTLHALLNKRTKDGCHNTTNTFRFVTESEPPVAELTQTLSGLDKGFVRKNAFDLLVARLSKVGRVDDALRVADTMVQGNYGANAVTYYPIIGWLSKRKKIAHAWRVMDIMIENGISPDLTAYNNLLTGYCVNGDVTSALKLLEKVNELGLGADTRTYDALVLGACNVGRVEGAIMVLRRMVNDDVSPLYCTYTNLIIGLLKLGYYSQAVDFVMISGGKDEKLDTETFGCLANRLVRLHRVEDAMFVLEEMVKRGLPIGGKLKDFYQINGGKGTILKEYKLKKGLELNW